MIDAHQNLNGWRHLSTPLSGTIPPSSVG